MFRQVSALTSEGDGICEEDGYKIFVPGVLQGETVSFSLTEKKKNYAKASLLRVVEPSPERVSPPCPYYGACGGCRLMHMSEKEQLRFKRQKVVDALERIAGFKNPVVQETIPSPRFLGYRNKIQLPIFLHGGEPSMGLYARESDRIIPVKRCLLHGELSEKVFEKAGELFQKYGFVPYEEKNGRGNYRHLLIKTAIRTNQSLLIVITRGKKDPALLSFAEEIMKAIPEIRGVIENINLKRRNSILGDTYRTVAGQPHIEEILSGLTFRISPHAFFQVNPYQVETLYRKALSLAAVGAEDTVLDAYCGIGTLSLLAASSAKRVIGIEAVPEAVRDAVANARRNGIGNALFYPAKAEEKIRELSGIEIVFLNPPRKGCDPEVLRALTEKKPKRMVYISCDPATLARDLKELSAGGFRIEEVQPVDMFPQTAHVETVVLLTS